MENQKVLIIGSGLGSLATALRLSYQGYDVNIVEQHDKPGGRLNLLEKDGFRFDMGPSFFSMSYEFHELFKSIGVKNPIPIRELDPLYSVYFEGRENPLHIRKDLKKMAEDFKDIEPDLDLKLKKYLSKAAKLFHDTEDIVINQNFESKLHYLLQLLKVPVSHAPKMFNSMWSELEKHFSSYEAKVIFSLVAFFLGSTPFKTPAIYSLLNYTELEHDGYWNVEGGMYRIVTEIVKLLEEKNVTIHTGVKITDVQYVNDTIIGFTDSTGKLWTADTFVCNADAASFRGKILKRSKYSDEKLDNLEWTLAPFTMYLGVKGKIDSLNHHNYFLRNNFKEYAENIFETGDKLDKPYYYVNVSSKSNPHCAPEGHENIFVLCPVPDLRFKKDWSDSEDLADSIIEDMSTRLGFNLKDNIVSKTILTPKDWESKFDLYKGSGLGLAHGLNQVGGFRPSNKDEVFTNLFYVGASTVPGTGLPMVIKSSKLVTERITQQNAIV